MLQVLQCTSGTPPFMWKEKQCAHYPTPAPALYDCILYPCCSDCKLSFSCNLLGGLALYLDGEGSIFPFCWCLAFSSGVRIATPLHYSTQWPRYLDSERWLFCLVGPHQAIIMDQAVRAMLFFFFFFLKFICSNGCYVSQEGVFCLVSSFDCSLL